MRTTTTLALLAVILISLPSLSYSDSFQNTVLRADYSPESTVQFPNLAGNVSDAETNSSYNLELSNALWPFSGNSEIDAMKAKSTRKAFFLSMLMPGLGEMYVGSKRSFLFLGVEAFAWYMYLTNNSEGNDIEDEYEAFANKYWHYSLEDPNAYDYWGYLENNYDMTGLTPDDYDEIADIIESAGESHSLPGTKTQQYYEMIGKYDHFVYGWEDIIDINSKLTTSGVINFNYSEDTSTIKSDLRKEYMDMRGDSNDKLKTAQQGLYIMMINRVLSAIDAGRLAYKHNKKLDSDLSMTRMRMAQKRIDNEYVPMLYVFRSF